MEFDVPLGESPVCLLLKITAPVASSGIPTGPACAEARSLHAWPGSGAGEPAEGDGVRQEQSEQPRARPLHPLPGESWAVRASSTDTEKVWGWVRRTRRTYGDHLSWLIPSTVMSTGFSGPHPVPAWLIPSPLRYPPSARSALSAHIHHPEGERAKG